MMSIRDYPGFRWNPLPKSDGFMWDAWEALFADAYILSIEGNFYVNVKDQSGHMLHVSIHHAMDYVKHKAIIDFFDEN